MGFKSVMKKVGKVALKVAPFAAMAIPGVGVPLGMAMMGGLSAADKKISGGSWKDALISGGIGAGLSAVGGKIPGLDKVTGLGTSKAGSFVNKAVGDTASKVTSGSGVKSILGQVGKGALGSVLGGGGQTNTTTPPFNPNSGSGVDWGGIGNTAAKAGLGSIFGSRQPSVDGSPSIPTGQAIPSYTNSSFGDAMSAGRNAAYASQPWRKEPQLPIYDPNKRRQLY